MKSADDMKASAGRANAAQDEAQQGQSQEVTRKLVELFGDADQTSIRMQGSQFHGESGKFSGVTNPDTRDKLRSAGLLLE